MGRKFTFTKTIFAFAILVCSLGLHAQHADAIELTDKAMAEFAPQWGLDETDINDYFISDHYTSRHNLVSHVYANQTINGLLVENAIINLSFNKAGEMIYGNSRFVAGLANQITSANANVTAIEALEIALAKLELDVETPRLNEEKDFSLFVFEKADFATIPVQTQLLYAQVDESIQLAWRTQIYGPKSYAIYVDANTGEVLAQKRLDISCSFEKGMYDNHSHSCSAHSPEGSVGTAIEMVDNSSYRVFALPLESPNHGSRTLETNPADPNASPFGWHDTDGTPGAEFTITRGNNVHAFYDPEADEVPPATQVDGGQDLIFDFDYYDDQEPNAQINNTVTQLFYMNNKIHDFAYAYGFTEEAGNFQTNNYGNGGAQGDYVIAFSQYGDGAAGTVNNATFATPGDGGNGQMRMFLWNSGSGVFQVTSPTNISSYYSVGTADYGPTIADAPAEGEVVIVDDGFDVFVDGCEEIVNADEVAGKIAMIDRGLCFFEQKTANAEAAGAIAVIICNFEDSAMGMAGVPDIDDPSIVTVSLSSSDCNLIKAALSSGPVSVKIEEPADGLSFIPGSYDNGVIAHEFAHGISNRLTGGPGAAGCLGNEEQMGEGWSDFFSLITTVEPGDTGADKRGIGTYATSEGVDGNGIRPYPYSTDMTINPMVYDNITTFSVPHGVGAVWCSMLWDMYWAFVDEYGYDADVYNTSAGNNMAIQLVMDGMAMQPCNPGFEDGRDAILAADQELFNGDNQCLIWEVFARRGLGINADQGDSNSRGDGTPNYESVPTCIAELKIKKEVTELIVAGDDIDVTLTVTNHRPEQLTNVVVTDEIPDGLTFDAASASLPGTVSGNTVTFELGDMEYLDELVITYKYKSDVANFSQEFYFDGIEDQNGSGNWVATSEDPTFAGWGVSSLLSYEGSYSFLTEDAALDVKTDLINLQPQSISGNRPTLRFWHNINVPSGTAGGYIEVSTDGAVTWQRVQDTWIRNGYNSGLAYSTFTIPFLEGFTGNSNGFIDSYLDLSQFIGEDIYIRFRFGTDANAGILGWAIDNFEIMDLLTYNSEACVSADQADAVCTSAEGEGTIVDSKDPVNTDELSAGLDFQVFPNPATDMINIRLTEEEASSMQVELFDATGKLVRSINSTAYGSNITTIPTGDLAKGIYMVKVISNGFAGTRKVILN